jgi:hypothetical protein
MKTNDLYIAVGKRTLTILIAVLLAILFALPAMLLWNWLMPDLFCLRPLNLLEAWGLVVLTKLFIS